MNLMPSDAPSSVTPLIRKHNSTTYGNTEEKYITYTQPILINIINNQITTPNKNHIYSHSWYKHKLQVPCRSIWCPCTWPDRRRPKRPADIQWWWGWTLRFHQWNRWYPELYGTRNMLWESWRHIPSLWVKIRMHLHVKSQISGISSSYLISQVKTTHFIMHYTNS